MGECRVLTAELRALRDKVETRVLDKYPLIHFASFAISGTHENTAFLTLGTERADLVQVQIADIIQDVVDVTSEFDEDGWDVDVQVVGGRLRTHIAT